MTDEYNWAQVVKDIAPKMGIEMPTGEILVNAESIRRAGDPYEIMHALFGPIATEQSLQIFGVEQHDGPKTYSRFDGEHGKRVTRRIPPDRFRVSWGPKPKDAYEKG